MKTSLKQFNDCKSVLIIQAEAITYRGMTAPATPKLIHLVIYTDQSDKFPLVTNISSAIRDGKEYKLRAFDFVSIDSYLDSKYQSEVFFNNLNIAN